MKNLALLTAVLAVFGVGQARADLLDLTNPPGQTDTPFSLSFVAGATTTDIVFGGYEVPSAMTATNISLTTGGGGNLLGPAWNFTPAPSGSLSFTFGDGTAVPAIGFAGITVNSFDEYDQEISTVIGQTYNVDFLLTVSNLNEPSGFFVDANGVLPTPEPGSLILLSLCLSGSALLARKKLAR